MQTSKALALFLVPMVFGLTGCGGLNGQAAPATGGVLGGGTATGLTGQGAPAPQPLAGAVTSSLVPASTGGLSSGSAADNARTLASAAAVPNAGRANDGRLTLTQYGGPTDGTPDSLTAAGLGNRNNQLRPSSLALSPNLIEQYGLRGGESIYVRTAQGTFFLGTYDDTTGNRAADNVIDVYDPADRLGRDSFLASIPPGGWQLAVGQRV
jgi:hypothetical protein